MKSKALILLLGMFVFLSCNENRIFEEHTDPSGNLEWNRDEVVEFDVNIEDASASYNVILALRYARGFMYTSLPVIVRRIAPGGEIDEDRHIFQVRNADGSSNGEVSGDIWDLEEIYRKNVIFPEKGIYHYQIRQDSDHDKMHMVMEVGLIIDKAVKQ